MNYGLRDALTRWNGYARVLLMHSSTDSRVRLGSDGWLFYSAPPVLDYHRHAFPFSETDLKAWGTTLQEDHEWLKKQGRIYVFAIAPDKNTVYGKHHLRNATRSERTRVDELVEYLKANHPELVVLDLRSPIAELAKTKKAFHKSDTHWNALSGWLASKIILERIGRTTDWPMRPETEIRRVPGGDLARMLGVQSYIKDENIAPRLTPARLVDDQGVNIQISFSDIDPRPQIAVNNASALGALLVFRDSFGEALIPYLSRSFRHSTWIWDLEFNRSLVSQLRPQVVLTILVERQLLGPVPK